MTQKPYIPIHQRVLVQIEEKPKPKQERPKAVYTNCPSPYGIADQLFKRKLVKQCKY